MSRKVKVGDNELSVRGLKRKEIKALKKKGYEIGKLKIEQVDDLIDEILPMIFNKKDVELIEDSPYKVSVQIWTAILKETYGSAGEEKNSSASGAGSQTEKE